MAAASSSAAGAESNAAFELAGRFFGVDPRLLLGDGEWQSVCRLLRTVARRLRWVIPPWCFLIDGCVSGIAVYNAGDDLVGLGLDELEKVLLKSHAVVPGKRVKGAGVKLDQAMKEEIQKVRCAASAVFRMRSRLARRRLSHATTL
jgi:hypothetical protein